MEIKQHPGTTKESKRKSERGRGELLTQREMGTQGSKMYSCSKSGSKREDQRSPCTKKKISNNPTLLLVSRKKKSPELAKGAPSPGVETDETKPRDTTERIT